MKLNINECSNSYRVQNKKKILISILYITYNKTLGVEKKNII